MPFARSYLLITGKLPFSLTSREIKVKTFRAYTEKLNNNELFDVHIKYF